VLHIILSHHGKLEFGSPKLPMIPEALMLNFLDDMDAKMQTLATEFQKAARQGKAADEMTDRIWALDQRTMLNSRAWLAEENGASTAPQIAGAEAKAGKAEGLILPVGWTK
jgi:3'-5' exoribonuclease